MPSCAPRQVVELENRSRWWWRGARRTTRRPGRVGRRARHPRAGRATSAATSWCWCCRPATAPSGPSGAALVDTLDEPWISLNAGKPPCCRHSSRLRWRLAERPSCMQVRSFTPWATHGGGRPGHPRRCHIARRCPSQAMKLVLGGRWPTPGPSCQLQARRCGLDADATVVDAATLLPISQSVKAGRAIQIDADGLAAGHWPPCPMPCHPARRRSAASPGRAEGWSWAS